MGLFNLLEQLENRAIFWRNWLVYTGKNFWVIGEKISLYRRFFVSVYFVISLIFDFSKSCIK